MLITFDIIWMNSSKSMVPSPLTSYSITRPRISSSVGFCPMDRNTGKSSLVVIVPLPSWSYDNVMKYKLTRYILRWNIVNSHRINAEYKIILPYQIRQKPLSALAFEAHLNLPTWSFILNGLWYSYIIYQCSKTPFRSQIAFVDTCLDYPTYVYFLSC